MALLTLLLCLFACTGPIEDRFTLTRARCGLGERPPEGSPTPPWPDTPECRQAIFDDLGLNPQDFDDETIYAPALSGAWELLTRDMGTVDALQAGPYLREPLLDELDALHAELGGEDVGRLVYNFVALHVVHTRPDDPETDRVMRFDVLRNTLELHPELAATLSPRFAAHALVHEASHDLFPRHVPCPDGDGEPRCDEGWAGAYGFEVGVADLAYTHCDGGDACWEFDYGRWSQATFILE